MSVAPGGAGPDVVVIGAGVNGLVAARLLSRAGLRTLVLERRATVGGVASVDEIHPGFHCPLALHAAGPLLPGLAGSLDLPSHGLVTLTPEMRVFVPLPGGGGLRIWNERARTARDLAGHSPKDAARYDVLIGSLGRIGRILETSLAMTPPSIDSPGPRDLWNMARLGKGFRDLGREQAYRLLRWGPMPVADFASEWFETEPLRAVIAARGIHGCFAGPRSAGTTLQVLMQAALDGQPTLPSAFFHGGMEGLTNALLASARAAGADVRTGEGVTRVIVEEGAATGVVLDGGDRVPAGAVVSGADPRSTLLGLLDPMDIDPDIRRRFVNYRSSGSAAKVCFALSGAPAFPGAAAGDLQGRIQIGEDLDTLERAFDAAKYGEFSPRPLLDITIPSMCDPALAPPGAHVMSVHVQFAPYRLREGEWASRREALAGTVEKRIEEAAPGFHRLVLARRVLTPGDFESDLGLSGGHLLHGEPAVDQFFTMRPVLGQARYRTPVRRLYLCGGGTHPGGGVTGGPGANAAREILSDLGR